MSPGEDGIGGGSCGDIAVRVGEDLVEKRPGQQVERELTGASVGGIVGKCDNVAALRVEDHEGDIRGGRGFGTGGLGFSAGSGTGLGFAFTRHSGQKRILNRESYSTKNQSDEAT